MLTVAETLDVLGDAAFAVKLAGAFVAALAPVSFVLCGARMVWDGYR